jgi:ubiquitin C-terminal hydrolase
MPSWATKTVAQPDGSQKQPSFKYDLYAVSNHYGSLTGGHCKLNNTSDDEKKTELLTVMYKYLQTQTQHASEMVTAANGTYLMIHGFLFVMILL